jgi:2-polyprenyl-3-methyl-5-hydroxy-6-metoxy-1,4-benzoquinol methylase
MPRDLSERSYEPEIMDAGIDDLPLYDAWLRQIETLNHLTLGYRPVLSWLGAQFEGLSSASVLDIGYGRGELLRQIWGLAQNKNVEATLVGIDTAELSAPAAQKATPPVVSIDYRVGNALTSGLEADFIICAHTTHHMTDAETIALIEWMETHARRGWFICDLRRSMTSYLMTKLLLNLAPVDKMVRHDGIQSIARAFTRREWQRLLAAAGVDAEIRDYFPFRLCVARRKL